MPLEARKYLAALAALQLKAKIERVAS